MFVLSRRIARQSFLHLEKEQKSPNLCCLLILCIESPFFNLGRLQSNMTSVVFPNACNFFFHTPCGYDVYQKMNFLWVKGYTSSGWEGGTLFVGEGVHFFWVGGGYTSSGLGVHFLWVRGTILMGDGVHFLWVMGYR